MITDLHHTLLSFVLLCLLFLLFCTTSLCDALCLVHVHIDINMKTLSPSHGT